MNLDLFKTPEQNDRDTMAAWPLGCAAITYASVAVALYVETGSPHVGMGWPVLGAIASLLFGVYIARRDQP